MTEVCTNPIQAASPDMATSSELVVPLRACAPWCTEGDGHADEMPDDRYCRTDSQIVPLSLGEPYASHGQWFLPSVDLYMTRERDQDEARFSLVHDELAPAGIRLTANELRRLVGASLMLLGKAEAASEA